MTERTKAQRSVASTARAGKNVALDRDLTKSFSGSANNTFDMALIRRTMETLWRPATMSADRRNQEMDAAFIALAAFKPTDEIEGMLAAQAVALHAATMELARRAMIPDQSHVVAQDYRNTAIKLSRGVIEVLDALDRKRGKNRKQVMRIERVTVQAGGQAVVGNVTPGATGVGGRHGTEIEKQPYETPTRLAHDPTSGTGMPPLRGKESSREPVPVARDAREDPLPASRRRQHGASNG